MPSKDTRNEQVQHTWQFLAAIESCDSGKSVRTVSSMLCGGPDQRSCSTVWPCFGPHRKGYDILTQLGPEIGRKAVRDFMPQTVRGPLVAIGHRSDWPHACLDSVSFNPGPPNLALKQLQARSSNVGLLDLCGPGQTEETVPWS